MTNQEIIERLCRVNVGLPILKKDLEIAFDALNAVGDKQRSTGYWIRDPERDDPKCVEDDNFAYKCSCCGHSDIQAKDAVVPYCWYCGARMSEQKWDV